MNQNDETHRYAELPTPNLPRGGFPDLFTAEQMRDFADRTHTLRTRAIPREAIEALLNQAMDQARAKGASMPDEVVEVAYWLVHPTVEQPVQKPKVVLELPDGDDRAAVVFFSEMKGDTLHLCITVTEHKAPQPDGFYEAVNDMDGLYQAEPDPADIIAGALQTSRGHAIEMMCKAVEDESLREALPVELQEHAILAITTAYEQGVGKGRQAYESGKEIANPYNTSYRCDLAWQYGYEEGKKQAKRLAGRPGLGSEEPIAWESTVPGYIKYVTQSKYEKFSTKVQRWYKPYKCSSCAMPPATWPSEARVWEALQAYLKHDTNMEGMGAALIVGAEPRQAAQEPVSPRHPVVIQWRDNAIEACAKIADAYGHEQAAQDMRAMLTVSRQEAQEPAMYVSPKQFAALIDPDNPEGELGMYLPVRKTRVGLFTQPLYTAPQPSDDVVKDAMRYQALRDGTLCHDDVLKAVKDPGRWEQPYVVLRRGSELDSAIDAALAARGGGA